MNREEQLEKAKNLGIKAFHNGEKCIPVLNKELMLIFNDRKIGEKAEVSLVELFTEWIKHWTIENLTAPIEKWH